MENPYASNLTDPAVRSHAGGAITPNMLQALAGTKPWVRFCSVLGFIGAGFMVLAGIVMMVGGGFTALSGAEGGPAVAGLPFVMGIVYLVFAALYLFPSMKLWSYGTHILNLMHSQSPGDLEAALEAQRAFWKFVGIMICIMIGLWVVMMLFVVVGAFATSAAFS